MKTLLSFIVAAFLSLAAVPFAAAENTAPASNPQAVVQDVININTADVETLTQLKGIGAKKAEAIVAWRETHGQFASVEQLLEVKGIGNATLEMNRERIRI